VKVKQNRKERSAASSTASSPGPELFHWSEPTCSFFNPAFLRTAFSHEWFELATRTIDAIWVWLRCKGPVFGCGLNKKGRTLVQAYGPGPPESTLYQLTVTFTVTEWLTLPDVPDWSLPTDGRIRYKRSDEYVEHFRDVFKASVADRLRTDRVGIFLSGGLDSGSAEAFQYDSPAEKTAYSQSNWTGYMHGGWLEDDNPVDSIKPCESTPDLHAHAMIRVQSANSSGSRGWLCPSIHYFDQSLAMHSFE
jgi:Asparagine synthase